MKMNVAQLVDALTHALGQLGNVEFRMLVDGQPCVGVVAVEDETGRYIMPVNQKQFSEYVKHARCDHGFTEHCPIGDCFMTGTVRPRNGGLRLV